ncbi:BspA family leucine-rich repeat surface protein, partial [Tenacibaculum sp.]|nr:BspA family leucine-rich repeat surface protein [Tenacibaculum sp.]
SNMFFECNSLGKENAGVIDLSNWNTATITDMSGMFFSTNTLKRAGIGNWDVSSVTNFNNMFLDASVFNENLNNWNIGENVSGTINLAGIFSSATKFNSPLHNWDVSKVDNFTYTLRGAFEFDQDLSSWDISNGTTFIGMLDSTKLSVENYDKTLQGWATLASGESTIPTNKELGVIGLHYGNATYRNTLRNTHSWTFEGDIHGGIEEEKFITTWEVASNDLTIPIYTTGGLGYNYTVDWGDGIIETGFTGNTTHTYTVAGTYTVKIYGDFPQMYFFNRAGKEKIRSIEQWGTNQWTGLDFSFYGCSNIELNADDIPDLSQAVSIGAIFQNATAFTDAKNKLKDWNVSTITSFDFAFQGTAFNRDISGWNMEAAEGINHMFQDNTVFNQPIGNWTFNNLKECSGLFNGATSFNQDLSNWDVSKVEFFSIMFKNATSFDQSLATWDISAINGVNGSLGMDNMFENAGLSIDNYDATLLGWATLDDGETQIPTNLTFHGGNSNYCISANVRSTLQNDDFKWNIIDGGLLCNEEDKFISIWKTTSNNERIKIRTTGPTSTFEVDWGDGTSGVSSSHTYATPGTYTVKISGSIGQLYANNQSVTDKMQSVEQWGASKFTSFRRAFAGADNVVINATDIPDLSNVTSMEGAFLNCKKLVDNGGQMQNWDVSIVENFTSTFQGASLFGENLGDWDISSMTSAINMLNGTAFSSSNYDKTIIGWSTVELEQIIPQNINLGASGINYCISDPERDILIGNGWSFTDAGRQCSDQDAFITTWKTTSNGEEITYPGVSEGVTYDIDWGDGTSNTGVIGTVSHTYATASEYQIKVSGGLTSFFINNSSNNDNLLSIDQWGTIRWESLARAFNGCDNLVLKATDTPDLSSVTNMNLMFSGSDKFEDLGGSIGNWDVSNVEVMGYLFRNTSFNSNINNWDVRNATFVGYMFANTKNFNQPLDKWQFSSINSLALMFFEAEAFNQDLSSWNVSHIESFASMFKNAKAFNQSLSSWDISNASDMGEMLSGTNLSVTNYDATLEGWAKLDTGETKIPVNVTLNADVGYCVSEDAHNILTSTPYNWIINDGGKACTSGLPITIYLQGAMIDPNSGEENLMRDDLRIANFLPTISPYADGITCESIVFDIAGEEAIVDWVWVELRDKNDTDIVIESQSALLQRNGSIVSVDGVSDIIFNQTTGNYYIAINHRNHLSVITNIAVDISATVLDLSSNVATVTGGSNALILMENGLYAIPGGDYDENGQIQNTDINS